MLVQNLSRRRMDDLREDPKVMHWTQSRFERVTRASVLLDGGSFLLTKTEFTAPKLVAHTPVRTEDVGATSRLTFLVRNDLETFRARERSFDFHFNTSYSSQALPHVDYTLWVFEPESREFVNLRMYPAGSYLLDLTFAESETVCTSEFTIIKAHSVISSYRGGAQENDRLSPSDRTRTLAQLAEMIRLNRGKLVVSTPQGQFEGDLYGTELLVNPTDLSTMSVTDLNPNTLDHIESVKLGEPELQRIFRRFMLHLGQCGVDYRK